MKTDPKVLMGIVVGLFVLTVLFAFLAGRCSAPEPIPVDPVLDVDAGPGEAEIAARLDAAVHAEDERLAELEREHADEVEALTDADRREYEETRSRGRSALASWFKDRSRRLLSDAGVTR